MRIAHINLSAELRGGELQTLALALALKGEVEQRMIVRRDSPLLERAASHRGFQIRPIGNSLIAAARATSDCDLVHIHDGRSTKAGAIASLWGRPFVVTRRINKPPRNRWLTRCCYRRAAAVAAVSSAASKQLQTYLGEGIDVETVHDGVKLPPQPKSQRKPGQAFVVGCVGELDDAVKGQRTLFAAARALRRSHPDIVFWVMGRGKDAARMRAWAADLPNLQFGGWVADMGSCYRDLDLLVHPARNEALGSAILEAMSFGVPVVASRIGGIPEIVRPGHNGELFTEGDDEALTQAIIQLHEQPALIEYLGRNARQTASNFSEQAMAGKYLALYRGVLAQHGIAAQPL